MAQVTIYLPADVEKAARASARRERKSLSAFIAGKLAPNPTAGGWPAGYVEMVRSWREDPLDLRNPDDEPLDGSEFDEAFR